MHEIFANPEFFGVKLVITPWKLIGFLGVILFTGRWFVQLWASRRSHKVVVPRLFWYMSITGSLIWLSAFGCGTNDAAGIMSNLFPLMIASYNLYLEYAHHAENVE